MTMYQIMAFHGITMAANEVNFIGILACFGQLSTQSNWVLQMYIYYSSLGLDQYRYWVSGIGRYSPVLVGIGIGPYLFEQRHRY